jgi:hypothetical protein
MDIFKNAWGCATQTRTEKIVPNANKKNKKQGRISPSSKCTAAAVHDNTRLIASSHSGIETKR